MAWYVPFFAWLVQSAVSSLLVLLAATTAVALTRQPARRIRIIELTLVGVLVVPLLGALPGYPRWSLLPALGDEGPGQPRGEVARSLAETRLEPRAEPATTGPVAEPLAAAPPETPVASELPTSPGDNAIGPADIEVPMAVEPAAPPSFATDYRFWIVAGYLAIAGALALWSLMGLAALWRLLRSARPAEPACRELLRQIAGPSGDRVALVVSPRAIQPCAVAWRPTTIVLGEAMCGPEARRQLRWVLSHEWSHVAHGDVWAWSLSTLVRCVYFYQPLVWLLRRRLRVAQDFVADAAAAGESTEDYAEFLATRAAGLSNSPLAAGLGIGGRTSDLQRRIVMLVDRATPLEPASPRRWNLVVLPLGILFVALVAGLGQRTATADEAAPADAAANQAGPAEAKPASSQSGPRKLALGDNLSIEVISNLAPDAGVRLLVPPSFTATVDEDGKVSLGGHYRATIVAGKSLREAEQLIADSLQIGIALDINRFNEGDVPGALGPVQINVRAALARPAVEQPRTVEIVKPAPPQPIVAAPKRIAVGDVLRIELANQPLASLGVRPVVVVEPDGNVALGAEHGRVKLVGRSVAEAEKLVQLRLAQTIKDPKVQITYRQPFDVDGDRIRKLEREIDELKEVIGRLKSAPVPAATQGTWRNPLRFLLIRDLAGRVRLYLDEQIVDEQTLARLRKSAEAGSLPTALLVAERNVSYDEVVKTIDRLAQVGVSRLSLDTHHVARGSK